MLGFFTVVLPLILAGVLACLTAVCLLANRNDKDLWTSEDVNALLRAATRSHGPIGGWKQDR